MEEPVVVGGETKKESPKVLAACKSGCQKIAEGWKARPSLWIALIVFLIGVVGHILVFVIPGVEYASAGEYSHYQVLNSLQVLAEALTYLGAFWLAAMLAVSAFTKKKS